MKRTKPIKLLGFDIIPAGLDEATSIIAHYLNRKEGNYFCLVDMNLAVQGNKSLLVKKALNDATANFPDSMGIKLALHLSGIHFNGRSRGADLMLRICEYAEKNKIKIFLYGNKKSTIKLLCKAIRGRYPNITIAGFICPPFRELSEEEKIVIINKIKCLSPDIIFVSLGAPKQEIWMMEHKDEIDAIKIGVGAAFDFIAGVIKPAPFWMREIGLEWLYRFFQQPNKVFKRIVLIPYFIFLIIKNIIEKNNFGN
jgi:N-acetylglucosaminyldiphosphoundecaprenol N-acetyl-beta-D-mannosaminyltransferase